MAMQDVGTVTGSKVEETPQSLNAKIVGEKVHEKAV